MEDFIFKAIWAAQIGFKGLNNNNNKKIQSWVGREVRVDLARVVGERVNTIKRHCVTFLKNE